MVSPFEVVEGGGYCFCDRGWEMAAMSEERKLECILKSSNFELWGGGSTY